MNVEILDNEKISGLFLSQLIPKGAGTLQNFTLDQIDEQGNFDIEQFNDHEILALIGCMEQSNIAIAAENDLFETYLAAMDPALIDNMSSILEATTAAIHKAERTAQLGMMAAVTTSSSVLRDQEILTPRSLQSNTGGSGSKITSFAFLEKGQRIQPTQKMEIIQREMDLLKFTFEGEKTQIKNRSMKLQCKIEALLICSRDIANQRKQFEDFVGKDSSKIKVKTGENMIDYFIQRNKYSVKRINEVETRRKNLKIKLDAVVRKINDLGEEIKYVDYEKLQILDTKMRENLESTVITLNHIKASKTNRLAALYETRNKIAENVKLLEALSLEADELEAKLTSLFREEEQIKKQLAVQEKQDPKQKNL